MSSECLMGLDAGSSGVCCLLVEVESGRVVTAFRPWTHQSAPGTGGWGFSLDLEQCWDLSVEAAQEVVRRANATPDQVIGMAVTSMRHTTIVLDRDGCPLLATPNRDARAASETIQLAAELGAQLHERTGHWPNPILLAARLRWLAATVPEAWEQAHLLLNLSDWLARRLCGETATDPSQAGETLLFDLKRLDWAWDLIDQLGLPRHLFPAIRQSGTQLGNLSADGASAVGLKAGIPIALGGADTQCGLLGAGVVAPGQVAAVAGSTTPVQLVTDQPLLDPQARMWTGCHVLSDLWVLESNAGAMGDALEWFASVSYSDVSLPLMQFAADAAQSPPGAAGVLSTVGAQVMNATQLSLPVGNLTMTHLAATQDPVKRAHIARAILEGMAYGLRANVEQMLSLAQSEQGELRLAGGMSRSSLWTQIVSDVINGPVSVPATSEATALGAAICAGVGAGVFGDLAEGAETLVRIGRQHTPDPQCAQTYQALYEGWQELRVVRAQADEVASGIILQSMAGDSTASSLQPEMQFRPRILVTAALDEASLAALSNLGHVEYASYRKDMRLLAGPDLVEELQGFHVFITEVDVVEVDSLQHLPDLRVVVTCRGHAVNVDVAACDALGIPVLHAPGRNADAVADLTLALMLMLARKLPEATAFLREPGSEAGDMARMGQAHRDLQGQELWRKTVGLVGLGSVGQAVARRLRPFGSRILVYDPFVAPEEVFLAGAAPVPLETLLRESDFVSLHAAVTDLSRGLIGRAELAQMKPGAFLINTARAALVDERALVEALRLGHLGGAGLDVFSIEPPGADHPLLALPNVIATPHLGGDTAEVAAHQGHIIAEDLERLVRGERPHHVLNPQTLDAFSWEGTRKLLSPEQAARLRERPAPAVSDLEIGQVSQPTPEPKTPPPTPPTRSREARASTPLAVGSTEAQMDQLLRAFVGRAVKDKALANSASGEPVTMHFLLRDLRLEFYLSFHHGQVTADLGPPPAQAEVRLKMNAEVLDGMFTGQISPTEAAMSGRLSFTGDTRLAMGLQRIQDDLSRLYTQAREEVGDIGDLALPKPVLAASTPAVLPLVERLGEELVRVVTELYVLGCITATGGNVSARVPGADQALITPSQLHKGELQPADLVHMDLEGHVLNAAVLAPSSEWPMHCAVYLARPDVGAIVHAHAPQATVLGLSRLPFLPISTEAAFLGDLPRVPFIMPGTQELAQAAVKALGDGPAVLLQNHGLLVAGSSLGRAAERVEVIERTAEVILGCYAVGKKPPTLPKHIVATLRRMGKMMA